VVTTHELVEHVMHDEFAAWEDALVCPDGGKVARLPDGNIARRPAPVYPHPGAPGGLPEGWEIRWHHAGAVDAFVVERAGGGWTMVICWDDAAGKPRAVKCPHSAMTLPGLHKATATGGWTTAASEQALNAFIASFYDLTDPVEAAAATLVGLGAPITVFPRALAHC
jgi:hypothetical protein